MPGETDAGTSSSSDAGPHMLHEQLARFDAAREALLERLARTHALLDDAARIVGPGFRDARTMAGVRDGHGRASHRSSHGAVLSLAEVSERTGRHPDLLRRWSEAGRIPAIRVGRSWAIPESALPSIEWPAARRRRPGGSGGAGSGDRSEDEQAHGRAGDVEG